MAKHRGIVELAQVSRTVSGKTYASSEASAVFQPAGPPDPKKTCITKTEGPCRVERCVGSGGASAPSGPYLDAGNIEGANFSKPFTLSFDNAKTGYALYEDASNALWIGGEMVTVAAKGGKDIAAFSTELKAPKGLTVGALPPGLGFLGTAYAVNKDKPYEVSWNDTANADVEVTIASASEDTKVSAVVTCRFDPATSPRSVPTSILAELVTSDSGTLRIGAVSRAVAPVNDAEVEVRLNFTAVRGVAEVSGTGAPSP